MIEWIDPERKMGMRHLAHRWDAVMYDDRDTIDQEQGGSSEGFSNTLLESRG